MQNFGPPGVKNKGFCAVFAAGGGKIWRFFVFFIQNLHLQSLQMWWERLLTQERTSSIL